MMPPLSLLKPANITPTIPCLKTTSHSSSTTTSNYNGKLTIRKQHAQPDLSRFLARSSAETVSTEKWEGGSESESGSSSVEVAKGPPSLISALNVEKALRGIPITDADHYGRLGLRRGCSYDLVRAAFDDKVKELSSQGLDDEKLSKELDLLKESYGILSSVEERRLYDWSLARTEAPERYNWPFEVDLTQTAVKGTPPPGEPEDVGPTVAVGYFFLGWLVLAFSLSIYLNQQ